MKVLVNKSALTGLLKLVTTTLTYATCASHVEAVVQSMEDPPEEKAKDEHNAAPGDGKKAVSGANK